MAASLVGAGAGVAALTGTGTVSKTGCIAGNLLLVHLVSRGNSEDWSAFSNVSNISAIDGTTSNITGLSTGQGIGAPTSRGSLFAGRATADGTCSADFTVGASGEDLFCRMYEFTGASPDLTIATVLEGYDGTYNWFGTGTSVAPGVNFVTTGPDRLLCVFVGLDINTTIGDFTGETSGLDLTEAVAEFGSASGATATLQLQTGLIATAGSYSEGSVTIASAGWGTMTAAILRAHDLRFDYSQFPKRFMREAAAKP